MPSTLLASTLNIPSGPVTEDRQYDEKAIVEDHAGLPMRFEPNVGQTDERVRFLARGTGYTLFLTTDESVMVFGGSAAASAASSEALPSSEPVVLRTRLEGANSQPEVKGLDPLPGITNYFIGNDPTKWHADIVSFSTVRYSDVYPGIDVVYYGNERNLEYDFVVKPGSDPAAIRLTISGADRLSVNDAGELVLELAGGQLRQQAPVIYQEGSSGRELVAGSYVVQGDEVTFDVSGYDPLRTLVIDPVLVYSTYLGAADRRLGRNVGPFQERRCRAESTETRRSRRSYVLLRALRASVPPCSLYSNASSRLNPKATNRRAPASCILDA